MSLRQLTADTEFVPPATLHVLVCPACGSISKRAKGQRGRLCGCRGWLGRNGTRCVEAIYQLSMYEKEQQ